MAELNDLSFQEFHLYVCLPFIELAQESRIRLGPVIFWPASKFREFIPAEAYLSFQAYMQSVEQIKTNCLEDKQFVNTVKLIPEGMTCVSIAESVPSELYEFILVDSLYLLYFACTFRNLYYGQEIPSFNAFRKMIPASLEFIHERQGWENLYIHERSREETVCLHVMDQEICQGLGHALETIYIPSASKDEESVRNYQSIVRSIRYLIDRFFQRFVNLFGKGLRFSEEIFKPEDVVFLAASFESLLDLSEEQPAADFKYKMRLLLHLRWGRPIEVLWKWADGFYAVKRRLAYGDISLDPIFRFNSNFEVTYIFLGIKFFIYSAYYTLFKYRLLHAVGPEDPYIPIDFESIHPDEILLFFWTEASLLRKLDLLMKQTEREPVQGQLAAEITLLTHLFVSMYERYYLGPPSHGVHFIPTPVAQLVDYGYSILGRLKEAQEFKPEEPLLKTLYPHFIEVLEDRLQERRQTSPLR